MHHLRITFLSALYFILAKTTIVPAQESRLQARQDQGNRPDLNVTGSSVPTYTRGRVEFTQIFKPELGQSKGIPYFATSIKCMYNIALGDWKGFEYTHLYKYPPYDKDVEIFIDGAWSRKPGSPGRWRRELVMDALLGLVRQAALEKKLEGFVSTVLAIPGKRREAMITFRRPRLVSNTPDLVVEDLQMNATNEITARGSEDTGSQRYVVRETSAKDDNMDYESWTVMNSSLPLPNNTGIFLGDGLRPEYYVKFKGALIPPSDWMIALVEGLRFYADGPVKATAPEFDQDIDRFSSHLQIGQYYRVNPRPDRVMTRGQGLTALAMLPLYGLENRVFQECTMVMERRKGEPVGIFKINKRDGSLQPVAPSRIESNIVEVS